MSTSHTIAEMLDYSRRFNLFYISKLDPQRVHEPLVVNGLEGNSAYWLIGHLIWGQGDVMMHALGEELIPLPWMRHFGKREVRENHADLPGFDELLVIAASSHRTALEVIRKQTDEDLEKEAYVYPAEWTTIRRKALYHVIRHESFHTGQLSLIAKAHGSGLP